MSSCSIDREFASAMLSGVMARVLSIASLLLIASYVVAQQILPSAPEPKKPVSPFTVPIGVHADHPPATPSDTPSDDKSTAPSVDTSDVQVLSEKGWTGTMSPAVKTYVGRVIASVRQHWYELIPKSARAPFDASGTVVVQFSILKDGQAQDVKILESSGNSGMDKAAWAGVTTAAPFLHLPDEVTADHLSLKFSFVYNPPSDKSKEQKKKRWHL